MSSENTHYFRDPIHGFIKISEKERQLIDSFEYQRLRRIRQLGLSYLVYPGAEHSRFSHCIGTVELATRAFKSIVGDKRDLFENESHIKRLEQLLRLAALLHDFGHPPFSHAAESNIMPLRSVVDPSVTTEERCSHEEWGGYLLSKTQLGEQIDELFGEDDEISSKDVIRIIQGKISREDPFEYLLYQILSSELDVDRMDYLLRDSRCCGVPYGVFDSDRLIQKLTVDDKEGIALAVKLGGLFSLEGLIIARYHMFLQVYFHDVRRCFDIILSRFLGGEFSKGLPGDPNEYLSLDDYAIEQMIKSKFFDSKRSDDLASRLLTRRHYKTLHESPTMCDHGEAKWIKALESELQQEFDAYKKDFFIDKASNVFSKFLPLSIGKEGEGSEITVIDEHGNAFPVQERSEIIKNMAMSKINIQRLYCHEDIYEKAKGFVDAKEGGVKE